MHAKQPSLIPAAVAARRWRRRRWRDAAMRFGVAAGGVSVIFAIALIFLFLVYVVLPLFKPAGLAPAGGYPLPGGAAGGTVHLVLDEQREIGVRYTGDGRVVFFRAADGQVLGEHGVALPPGAAVTAFAAGDPARGLAAYGLGDGRALVLRLRFEVSYPGDMRRITPRIEYPLGEGPLDLGAGGSALRRLAVQGDDEATTVAALAGDGRLYITSVALEESLLGDGPSTTFYRARLDAGRHAGDYLLLGREQRVLYLAGGDGWLTAYDIGDKEAPAELQRLRLVREGERLTAFSFLTGDISVLAGDSAGRITQWFPVRDASNNRMLRPVRVFDTGLGEIEHIVPELRRKGFLAAGAAGAAGVFHATAERSLIAARLGRGPVARVALAPRADGLLALDSAETLRFWHIENEHPEVSWSALWGRVWYESYERPEHIWQSSSASNDFEPKFSLVPLAFGTLKAAFYAMLVAVPLAVMGAIYTASFMAPRMRRLVKPGIEIMEALPTVILGFLAGLWLAPFVERHLLGVFAVLLIVPPGILLFAGLWQRLPAGVRGRVPAGWDAALLMPVVALLAWLALAAGPLLEGALFGGDLRGWLGEELGVDFDQRNSLVVGIAMGFAVIPTIFSLAEDAIFSVPRHLRMGSLALGATEWQTLVRVVLLTASPGIFAAVMIGLGRAVGETMIVLMATGNTPVMDFSIFQGMRTLSANIAVEMPESEVGSTHYRILFLAALVLFAFTFVVNTAGEIVRQRLRARYGSL